MTKALLLILTFALVSCETFYKDEKFKHAIAESFDEAPGVVVTVVDETIAALKLRITTKTITHIDGRFEVRSAMGNDFRVLVEGLRTNHTRVEIDMPDKRHQSQAELIMTEISSRIRLLRPAPAPPVVVPTPEAG